MRHERHGKAENRRDLRRVAMCADVVGGDVLENRTRMRGRLRGAARSGHPRHGVDEDRIVLDQSSDRREGEQHGRRVATGIRDEPFRGRCNFRKGVRPGHERRGIGMLEAVPRLVDLRISETVRTGEIDDDAARGRRDRCGLLVAETEEDDVGATRQRRVVRDEAGDPAPPVSAEPRVERVRGPPGERVRAEGIELEAGMGEDAVQRLLARVAGGHRRSLPLPWCLLCTSVSSYAIGRSESPGSRRKAAATLRARWNGYSSSTQATSP